MSDQLFPESQVGAFSCQYEDDRQQQVACVLRNGEAYFVFNEIGKNSRTAIHADNLLRVLTACRENPLDIPTHAVHFTGETL